MVIFDKFKKDEDSDVWYNKGTALGKRGKSEDAIVCFDKALEINPNFVDAWHSNL